MTPQVTVVGVWCNDDGYYKDEWFAEAVECMADQTHRDHFHIKVVFFGASPAPPPLLVVTPRHGSCGLYGVHRPALNYTEARAAVMDLVTTPWACVIDFDDIYEPTLIEKKLAYAKEHPDAVMIASFFKFMDAEGKLLPQRFDAQRLKERIARKPDVPPVAHPGIFIRMDAYRACGGYNTKLQRAEDHDLWKRLGKHGDWGVVPEYLWTYRRHDGQMVKRPYTGGKS